MLRIFIIILVSALLTFLLRGFPFFAFRGERQMPEKLSYLGKILPSAIMAVLIVYCLKDMGSISVENKIAKLLAVLLVGITYKWRHSTFLSIVAGTSFYMLLLHI